MQSSLSLSLSLSLSSNLVSSSSNFDDEFFISALKFDTLSSTSFLYLFFRLHQNHLLKKLLTIINAKENSSSFISFPLIISLKTKEKSELHVNDAQESTRQINYIIL
jgi:hypothetical protein